MKTLLFVLVLCGCAHVPPAPPPGTATCTTMCERARQLMCPHGQPTAKGTTCEVVCTEALDTGLVEIDLECRTQASSCDAMAICER